MSPKTWQRVDIVRGISAVALAVALLWLVVTPSFEPIVAALLGLAGLLSTRRDPGARASVLGAIDPAGGLGILGGQSLPVDRTALAVLPLQNIGGDDDNEAFADGLTEDIISHLSHVEDLRVISRTSVMRFKQTSEGTREIAAALGVGSILEGSVRRTDDRLRVVVQLIDAGTDSNVWSETYDRELDDVFAIQTEIALRVTSALSASLTAGEEARIRRRPSRSLSAHDLYYLGRHHWWSFSEDGLLSAKDNFERAIELDPLYAPAHSGLALTYLVAGRGGAALFSMAEAMPKAKAAAEKAISLDPSLGDAYGTLALVHAWFEWDWLKAKKVGREGVRVEPSSSIAWGGLAYALDHVGKPEEAVQASERFVGLDPLAALAHQNHGLHLFNARRADEARSYAQRAMELGPNQPWGRTLLADITMWQGDAAKALALLEPLLEAAEVPGYVAPSLGAALGAAGMLDESLRVGERLEAWAKDGQESWSAAAVPFAWSGDLDHALELLERVPEQRPPTSNWPAFMAVWPLLDPVRDDPRFRVVLQRVGLSPRVAKDTLEAGAS